MKIASASSGAFGVDTVSDLTTSAPDLAQAGVVFVVRYLGTVTVKELSSILAAGLAFMPVTRSRAVGWVPSAAVGESDGKDAIAQVAALGLPAGITVWVDLEGPGGDYHGVIDYVNAWAQVIRGGGFDPGVYVGEGTMLTGGELHVTHVDELPSAWGLSGRSVDQSLVS